MDINNDYVDGIVIYESRHGETSKILKVFTKKMGKISIMAKGALIPSSPILSLSQTFVEAAYLLRKGRNFYYIKSGSLINSNYELRKNFTGMIYASLILEIIEKSTMEHNGLENVYGILSKSLKILQKTEDPLGKTLAFFLKYASFMGYRPSLQIYDNNFFSPDKGTVFVNTNRSYSILKEDIYYLNNLLYTSLDKDFNYNEDRKKYLLFILIKYLKYNLEIGELNSLKFL